MSPSGVCSPSLHLSRLQLECLRKAAPHEEARTTPTPTSLTSKPWRRYTRSLTYALSHHRHITRPVSFQVTAPFSLVPLVKLSCSRWVAGPLFGGDWLARLCWANVAMVGTLTFALTQACAHTHWFVCGLRQAAVCTHLVLAHHKSLAQRTTPMTQVEKRWPESSYFLLAREAQRASGVSG